MGNKSEPEMMNDKREHLTGSKFGAHKGKKKGREEGKHLHETDHHGRGYSSEMGSHHAFPDHEGSR